MSGTGDLTTLNAVTVSGVLDFNATEGTVAMPPLIVRNLFGDGMSSPPEGATVTVTYRRLPKGALHLREVSAMKSTVSYPCRMTMDQHMRLSV